MRRTQAIRFGVAALTALLVFGVPATATAQSALTVNTELDLPPDQSCTLPDDCTLREAVSLASGGTIVNVPPGHYRLTQPAGELFLTSDVIVGAAGARNTIIDGVDNSRVLWVTDGTTRVSGVTIQGGNGFGRSASPGAGNMVGPGGGIYVESGVLLLEGVAVVDNATTNAGGGIATAGGLAMTGTTVSGNRAANGGGIAIANGDSAALANSTVSGNIADSVRTVGGGILALGSLSLDNVTVAGNEVRVNGAPAATGGGGIYRNSGQVASTVTLVDTIVSGNAGRACDAATQALIDSFGGNHNLDDDGTCGFSAVGDQPGVNPVLGPLVDNGGPTNTHALIAGSPAIDGGDGANCRDTDQRGFARPVGACDMGAFEYFPPTVTPSQPPPDDDDELPPPVAGRTVNALPQSGRVRIRLPGTDKFVRLSAGQQVPVGTVFDTRNGHVTLVAAANRQGGTATAEFWAGIFRLGQTTGRRPITTLTLTEQIRCPIAKNSAIAAAKKKKKRRLWGDGNGRFRTKGKHSAATVVGTKWLVEDRCKSTLTRVVRGRVSVRDFAKKKTVIVRRGKRYVARAG